MSELPYAHAGPCMQGQLRQVADDFQVCEIPICEPDGSGEHLWLWVRKRNANTEWVARQLARWAGVSPAAVSYAGLKDRYAVTEQGFSIHLPGRSDPDRGDFSVPDVEILRAERHSRKLKRGALRGNRFQIRIRQAQAEPTPLKECLSALGERGIANYFGEQRFGRCGSNLSAAEALFEGRLKSASRHQRSLYLSAARSYLFNHVVATRVRQQTWDKLLAGDILQLDGRSALFEADHQDDSLVQRMRELEVHPTGPLWGQGELATRAAARQLEEGCVNAFANYCRGLEQAGLKQARRALRVRVRELTGYWACATDFVISFELPAGSYATTVLREILFSLNTNDFQEEAR